MKRFEDKIVLVTGAGSGIGRATAERLAEEGASVACVDINADAAAETATKLGPSAMSAACDVGDPESVQTMVDAVIARYGQLNVLCNVAGVLQTNHTHEFPIEDWHRILRVNLTGTFLVCRAALPHLLQKKGNNIVNVSSTAALGSHPWMAAYAASKGGVLSLTKCLAVEYVKKGLRANSVCPGGINTPFHAQFSMPEGADPQLLQGAIPFVPYVGPEHVASTIAFLASDDARYMNGTELRVDGGALS